MDPMGVYIHDIYIYDICIYIYVWVIEGQFLKQIDAISESKLKHLVISMKYPLGNDHISHRKGKRKIIDSKLT